MQTNDTDFLRKAYAHQWDSEDIKALGPQYREHNICTALEKADSNQDWEAFGHIMNKYPWMDRHIMYTGAIFEWNFWDLLKKPKKRRS